MAAYGPLSGAPVPFAPGDPRVRLRRRARVCRGPPSCPRRCVDPGGPWLGPESCYCRTAEWQRGSAKTGANRPVVVFVWPFHSGLRKRGRRSRQGKEFTNHRMRRATRTGGSPVVYDWSSATTHCTRSHFVRHHSPCRRGASRCPRPRHGRWPVARARPAARRRVIFHRDNGVSVGHGACICAVSHGPVSRPRRASGVTMVRPNAGTRAWIRPLP
jgi:hypothetical protein